MKKKFPTIKELTRKRERLILWHLEYRKTSRFKQWKKDYYRRNKEKISKWQTKSKNTPVICTLCGSLTYKAPYKFKKAKHRFCNNLCSGLWTGRTRALKGNKLKRVDAIQSFWYVWAGFYPKTQVYLI